MRDIMEMSYEAHRDAKGNAVKQQELFTEMFFAELMKMKSADISPHLTCVFDVIKHEYRIELTFPVGFHKADSVKCDVE